jgi:hypothetical protein
MLHSPYGKKHKLCTTMPATGSVREGVLSKSRLKERGNLASPVKLSDKASELFTDFEGLAASWCGHHKFCITLPSRTSNCIVNQRHSYCCVEKLMLKAPLAGLHFMRRR